MANIDPWSVFENGGQIPAEIPASGDGSIDRELLRDKFSARNRVFWNQSNQSGRRRDRESLSYKSPNIQLDPAVQYRVVGENALADFNKTGIFRGNWAETEGMHPASFYSQGVPLYSYGETALREGRNAYLIATLGEDWGDRSTTDLRLSPEEKAKMSIQPTPISTPFTKEELTQLRALKRDIGALKGNRNYSPYDMLGGQKIPDGAKFFEQIVDEEIQKGLDLGHNFYDPKKGLAEARKAGVFLGTDKSIDTLLETHAPIIDRLNSSFKDFLDAEKSGAITSSHPMVGWLDFFRKGNRKIDYIPKLLEGLNPTETSLTLQLNPFGQHFKGDTRFSFWEDIKDVARGRDGEYWKYSLGRYPEILDNPEVVTYLESKGFYDPNKLEPEFNISQTPSINSNLARQYQIDRLTTLPLFREMEGMNLEDIRKSLQLLRPSTAGTHWEANANIFGNFLNRIIGLHGTNAPAGEPNPFFIKEGFNPADRQINFSGANLTARERAFALHAGVNPSSGEPLITSSGSPPYLPLNNLGQPVEAKPVFDPAKYVDSSDWRAVYGFAPKGSYFDRVQPEISQNLVRLGGVDDNSPTWDTRAGIQKYLDLSFFKDQIHNRGNPFPLAYGNLVDQGSQGAMQSERLPRGAFEAEGLGRTVTFPAHSINAFNRPTVIFKIDPNHPQGLVPVFESNNQPLPNGSLPIPTGPLSEQALKDSGKRILEEIDAKYALKQSEPQGVVSTPSDVPPFLEATAEEKNRSLTTFSLKYPEVAAKLLAGTPVDEFAFEGNKVHFTNWVRDYLGIKDSITDKSSAFGLRSAIEESTRGSPTYGRKGFAAIPKFLEQGVGNLVLDAKVAMADAEKFRTQYVNNITYDGKPNFRTSVHKYIGGQVPKVAVGALAGLHLKSKIDEGMPIAQAVPVTAAEIGIGVAKFKLFDRFFGGVTDISPISDTSTAAYREFAAAKKAERAIGEERIRRREAETKAKLSSYENSPVSDWPSHNPATWMLNGQ